MILSIFEKFAVTPIFSDLIRPDDVLYFSLFIFEDI